MNWRRDTGEGGTRHENRSTVDLREPRDICSRSWAAPCLTPRFPWENASESFQRPNFFAALPGWCLEQEGLGLEIGSGLKPCLFLGPGSYNWHTTVHLTRSCIRPTTV